MKQSLKPYFFWENEYFLRGLFLFNSLLVFWYFSNSIVGNKTPATSFLLLLSLLFLIPALKNLPDVWATQKWWILALLAFGGFHVLHLYLHGTEVGDDYDKPTKAIAAVLIFFYLLRYGFSDKVVGVAIAVSAVAAGGYAIYEVFALNLHRAGTMTNPIRYGYLTVTMALLCFFYLIYSQQRWLQILYGLSGCVGLAGAYCTGTRGIALILIGVAYLLVYRLLKTGYLSRSKLMLAFITAIVVLVTLAFSADLFQSSVKRTVNEVQKTMDGNWNNSLGYRLQMWHLAIYLGSQEPLSGAGQDYTIIREKASEFIQSHNYNPIIVTRFGHFHNQYLDAFAKQGLPGLAVWLFLLVAAMTGMKSHYKYAVGLIVLTLVMGGLTEAVLRSSRLFYLIVIGISVFRCLDYKIQHNNYSKSLNY